MPDNFVAVSFENILALLPPSATCWGEHDASDEPNTAVGAFPLQLSDLREHGGGIYPDGTTYYAVGRGTSNRLPVKLGTTFFANLFDNTSSSLNPPPPPTGWGGRSPTHTLLTVGESTALAASRAIDRGLQRLAYLMSTLRHADAHPWGVDALNAVALELQYWYQRHSICRYLARQTQHRLAATTIQCWKQRIWLDRWLAQQALQRQKHFRLQLLCHGASMYAVSVQGNC